MDKPDLTPLLEEVRRTHQEYLAALEAEKQALIALVDSGMTYREVAAVSGLSHARIHTIYTGKNYKSSQSFNGSQAEYTRLHHQVSKQRGKPRACETCGTTSGRFFDWANQTGRYDDPNDYKRLCRSCHSNEDAAKRHNTT